MSLQGIRQNEYTDEAKASAALTVLNHDSFPCDLKLNSQQAILLSFCTVLYDCLKLKLVKKKAAKKLGHLTHLNAPGGERTAQRMKRN